MWKKVRWDEILGIILAITIIAMIIAVARKGQTLDNVLLAGLIAVTTWYAYATIKIARATKEQADASMEMAKEMENQRLSEARPYLLLRLTERYIQWDDIEGGQSPPNLFSIIIYNAGKGPAVNLRAGVWSRTKIHPSTSNGYLACGQEWQTTISKIDTELIASGIAKEIWLPELKEIIEKDNRSSVIAVEYQDIYHRIWVSYLYLVRWDHQPYVMDGEQNIVELKPK